MNPQNSNRDCTNKFMFYFQFIFSHSKKKEMARRINVTHILIHRTFYVPQSPAPFGLGVFFCEKNGTSSAMALEFLFVHADMCVDCVLKIWIMIHEGICSIYSVATRL